MLHSTIGQILCSVFPKNVLIVKILLSQMLKWCGLSLVASKFWANCSLKMCALTGGIEQGNIAGPAAPLGPAGGGQSDFCPLVLELLLGRLGADPITKRFQRKNCISLTIVYFAKLDICFFNTTSCNLDSVVICDFCVQTYVIISNECKIDTSLSFYCGFFE